MPKAEPINLVFEKERETKNKVRFQEANIDTKKGPVVDKLYVSKAALKKMGDPDILHVHIQAP